MQYRLHAVRIDAPTVVNARVETRFRDHSNFSVEVAERPRFRIFHQKPPLRVLPKDQPIKINLDTHWPDPDEDGYRAPYVWLTAIADSLFPISANLHALSPDERMAFMTSIRTRVPIQRWDALLNDARLVAAVAAAEYQGIVVERWGEAEIAFPDADGDVYWPYLRVEMQALDDVPANGADVQVHLRDYLVWLAKVHLRDVRVARRISVAGQALIRARQERFDSLERFLGTFRSVEVLATLDEHDNTDVLAKFATLNALIPEYRHDLTDFVKTLKETYRPPLSARFAKLARDHSPETAESDIMIFRKAAKLRNSVMHGKSSGTAWDDEARRFRADFERVANRYLHRVLAKLAAT